MKGIGNETEDGPGGFTSLQSIDCLIFARWFISFRNDGRDATTSFAVTVHCHLVETFASIQKFESGL
jgi:hypothetical protein